ncbi:glycosyltransferase family 4 protein [Candidatus Bathyarchaeota archaeon]|nr:glycosyltransferase family 4 protein [Candidatus Bathyarchaeota archaeon]
MRVNVFAGGFEAHLSVRILPLMAALEKFGVLCKVIRPIDWHSTRETKLRNALSVAVTHSPSEYAETLRNPPNVAIFGRISTPQIYLLQKLLRSKGVKIVYDMDDALFLPTSSFLGVRVRPGLFCLEDMIRDADFVTVNGHYLLDFAKPFNGNATIIHDPVDTELFHPSERKQSKKVTIGWEGSASSHYGNLAMLVKPLKMLSEDYDICFKIVSYLGDMRVKQLFRELEDSLEVDYGLERWVPLREYSELLSDFDIMVAPLMNSTWYEGKSAFRVGIGMAMGIPVVASPVGEQRYVVKHGTNGYLAKNEEEFYMYLRNLIKNCELRREIGKKGRETAENELSSAINGKRLFEILRSLVEK